MLNFTVGPVMSPADALEVGSHSAPYFRTAAFAKVMLENEQMLLDALYAPEGCRCVFLTASGTGAMEACVMGLLNDKDKVLVINGGTFGQRFAELCRLHHREMTEIRLEFGHSLRREQLEPFAGRGYTALLINMHETSSGVLYDMPMVAKFCKENGILLAVDAISSFLADELDMSALGAAAVIVSSQKALAVQPGISAVALAPKALEKLQGNEEPCMYLSLKEALKNGERGQTPFTPAVTTLLQIHTRLKSIAGGETGHAQGRSSDLAHGGVQERKAIAYIAEDFRNKIKDLPFELVSESMSNAVTALHPLFVSAKEVVRILMEEYQIWVCPNGGEKADEVFRVGHIGAITPEDNQKLVDALHDMDRKGLLHP